MTDADRRDARLRTVARLAMRGYETLPPADRIELLLSLAEMLPEADAEAARLTAFTIQEAEANQLKFAGLLRPAA